MLTPPPTLPRHRARGLTLIELVIALAVLAVLGTLALPDTGAQLTHRRLQATAQALVADVGEARFEAARRGSTLHLQSQTGAAWCWAVTTTPGCGCGSPQPSCQLQRVRASDHAGITLASSSPLAFAPTAEAGVATTVAVFENGRGEKMKVEISALGRPRLCAVAGRWAQVPKC